MARFDKLTLEFMEKIAGDSKEVVPEGNSLSALRTVKSVLKSIQDPQKAIGKALVSGLTMQSLTSKEASLSVLKIYSILNDAYDKEWWHWEPETIWQTLAMEHSITGDDDLKNLVMALQLCVTTNQPFESWHVFEKVGHAFNSNTVNFEVVQPLEPQEAALTIKILRTIRPEEKFATEVSGYLAAVAKNAGIVVLLPTQFTEEAQGFLEGMGNDHALAAALVRGADTESAAYKIQAARLKEIEHYIKDHI
ncbi:MAG: hypothetical protein MUP21_02040 [Dehalococcoidia bacterium]|nr:hypothetical protein [Dehalococcoidia bacterium]